MATSTRRGYSPGDRRDFAGPALETLRRSSEELCYLLNRGYPAGSAALFVGNRYQLSQRQRNALMRLTCSDTEHKARCAKRREPETLRGATVYLDGFNQIITLETALYRSLVLRCMDGAYRDLAGLRGTYRLIEKTDEAIGLLFACLRRLETGNAVFLLDAPVSNSGRLKTRIAEIAEKERFPAEITLTESADKVLYGRANVITSDSAVLDRCESWVNLCGLILPDIPGAWIVSAEKGGKTI